MWIHVALLALTLFTTTLVGGRYAWDFALNQAPFPGDYFEDLWAVLVSPSRLLAGLPFSLTLLGILMAHEMGHFVACRLYRVDASWPYFLPVPTPVGTMGAFIKIQSPILTRAALFDIGIAGPLAGFLLVLPALAIGLAYSKVVPGIGGEGLFLFGEPLAQRALAALILPGVSGDDIALHPVARAAWVGMLATALNLLPIGQLDGGHILYVFAGEKHKTISRVCVAAPLVMGLGLWYAVGHASWVAWAVVLWFLGMRHPAIEDRDAPGAGRLALALLAAFLFVITFSVVPLSMAGWDVPE
ncbi:MAG: site-2 protease family protein [Bryobacterales bacterium]|nr:site-2 protease family protein [Bryobacterales bacterium]